MKIIRLNAAKTLFMIALFCPFTFADDGDQGSGGLGEPGSAVVKTTTPRLPDGDQGSGVRPTLATSGSYIDTVLESVYEYFDWLM